MLLEEGVFPMNIRNLSLFGLLFFTKGFSAMAQNTDQEDLEFSGLTDSDESEYEASNGMSNFDDYDVNGRRLTVFPPDGRVEYDPAKFQRGVGLLSYLSDGEYKNCTATLINRELILTAAKCVVKETVSADGLTINRAIPSDWATAMQFQFGYTDGKPGPYNSAFKQMFVPSEYMSVAANWPAYNFAVIQLRKALGDVVGHMNVQSHPASSYKGEGVNLVSFMYKDNTTASADYCCPIIGNVDGRVKHLCDTADGSDGAPLYVQTPAKKSGGFDYTLVAMNNEQGATFNLAAATQPIVQLFKYAAKHIVKDPKFHGAPFQMDGDLQLSCDITKAPTMPTRHPTKKPTHRPTREPSTGTHGSPVPTTPPPTNEPTPEPTNQVTKAPTMRTRHPTKKPTHKPPTHQPSTGTHGTPVPTAANPTPKPTAANPTPEPTHKPTEKYTHAPTQKYTHAPTSCVTTESVSDAQAAVLEANSTKSGLRMRM
jgi:V8-like Glu-specific endopeptidase